MMSQSGNGASLNQSPLDPSTTNELVMSTIPRATLTYVIRKAEAANDLLQYQCTGPRLITSVIRKAANKVVGPRSDQVLLSDITILSKMTFQSDFCFLCEVWLCKTTITKCLII